MPQTRLALPSARSSSQSTSRRCTRAWCGRRSHGSHDDRRHAVTFGPMCLAQTVPVGSVEVAPSGCWRESEGRSNE
jgi:hypothetical protein